MAEFVHLKIKRQDGPDARPRWEEFKVPYTPGMNVIVALMEVRKNPVMIDGRKTTPVVWESNCLEEVCGACSMVINGHARQACSTIIDHLEQPVVLEPMNKFPVVRDLMVDRGVMFDHLKRVKAWIPIDGTYDLGPGPRMNEKVREEMYELSKCMTCGVCVQVCPQFNNKTDFIGAFAISQARLFNNHPTGAMNKSERLEALMEPGGIMECGNAQNCVEACPKGIPLTKSIADMNRETTLFSISRWVRH